MPDIFLSYASEDRLVVQPLVERLRSEGWDVWWDRNIETGAKWEREIEAALDSSRCVVVVWSADSVASDWVRNEAREGLDRGILVPLAVGGVKVPLGFRHAQSTLVSRWPTLPASSELDAIVGSVRSLLRSEQAPTPTAAAAVKPVASTPITLAVVPLSNSRDAEADYLNEGIAEELIIAFKALEGIDVLSRVSSFGLEPVVPGSSGGERTAEHLLTTSTRKAGQRVRVTVELTDQTRSVEWSERYDETLEDIFDLQDDIARKVTARLLPLFRPSGPMVAPATDNPLAYNAFLRGKYEFSKHTKSGYLRATDLFDEATRVAPGFKEAYEYLAFCYTRLVDTFDVPREKVAPLVADVVERSHEVWDGVLPTGLTLQQFLEGLDPEDVIDYEARLEDCIERILDPAHPRNEGDAAGGYLDLLQFILIPLVFVDSVIELSARMGYPSTWSLSQAGRYQEAIADLDQEIAKGANSTWPRLWRALNLARTGQVAKAEADLEHLQRIFGYGPVNFPLFCHKVWTRDDGAGDYFEELLAHPNLELRLKAIGAVMLGDIERALTFLESDGGDRGSMWATWHNLHFYAPLEYVRAIEREPRFLAWRERVKLGVESRRRIVRRLNEISAVTGLTVEELEL